MYCTMRIHLSMLGVIFTPPQYQLNGTMSRIGVDMLAIRTQGCIQCDNLLGCSSGMSTHQLVYCILRTALGLISTKHPSWPFFNFIICSTFENVYQCVHLHQRFCPL